MTAPTSGALSRNPENLNQLQSHGWVFQIKKLPNVNFYMQEVEIPDLSLPAAVQTTPFNDVHWPGNNLTVGDLDIQFKVDEDLTNYKELNNWITTIGFQRNTKDYGDLTRLPKFSGLGVTSDASIITTTGLKNPNVEFVFHDCWPSYLSKLRLKHTVRGVEYVDCTATFKYTLFTITSLAKS